MSEQPEKPPISRVRDIACSYQGNIFGVIDNTWRIHLWDLCTRKKVAEFQTVKDSGGLSVAVTPDGELCFAGSYYSWGLACFSIRSQTVIWKRKDLKRFYGICFSELDQSLFAYFDGKAGLRIDPYSGETLDEFRGVKQIFSSPFDKIHVFAARDYSIRSLETAKLLKVQRRTGIMSTAFSPDKVMISEVGGTVRCFDLTEARPIWEYRPPLYQSPKGTGATGRSHLLSSSYSRRHNCFVGIEWPFQFGGKQRLKVFDVESGNDTTKTELDILNVHQFLNEGSLLLDAFGRLIDVASGKVVHVFDFPMESKTRSELEMELGTAIQRAVREFHSDD